MLAAVNGEVSVHGRVQPLIEDLSPVETSCMGERDLKVFALDMNRRIFRFVTIKFVLNKIYETIFVSDCFMV